ncbi:MAG: tRNA lysidine(34) synthetase TilS, partial [Deltaproteobacteria bacterium]
MSKAKQDLAAQVDRTVREQNLFQHGDTIIVAISGGADSTAMLDLLSRLPNFSLKLVAAHMNHSLRGSESDKDEDFCRQLALRYSIPFESRWLDVREYAGQNHLNLEDAGRRLRTAFFNELRDKWRAAAVALAHHADDQAETFL